MVFSPLSMSMTGRGVAVLERRVEDAQHAIAPRSLMLGSVFSVVERKMRARTSASVPSSVST